MTEDTTAPGAPRDPHGGEGTDGSGGPAAAAARHPSDGTRSGPDGERPDRQRRLERVRDGRLVTGVCAGLGHYTRIDPVVLRVGFTVLVFATFGVGTLLYVAAFLLMGEEDGSSSAVENVVKRRLDGDAVLAILGALFAVGVFLNVVGGGLSGDVLVVVTLFGLVLLVVHARGVDVRKVVGTLSDRLLGGQPVAGAPTADAGTSTAPEPPPAAATPTPPAAASTDTPRTSPADMQPTPPTSPDTKSPAGPTAGLAASSPPGKVPAAANELVDLARLAAPGHGRRGPYSAPAPVRASGRSAFTPLTLFAALAAIAAMIPVAAPYSPTPAVQMVLATGLGVVALGLFAGSWFGRGRGLVAVGTVLSLGLVSTSVATELPARGSIGDLTWKPAEIGQLDRPYRVFAGNGSLDLTELALRPGQRVKVTAEVSMGEFRITVPRATRVEVHARSGIGDITVDEGLTGGVRASVRRVLPAEGGRQATAPTIELHVRAGLGNLEVRRA